MIPKGVHVYPSSTPYSLSVVHVADSLSFPESLVNLRRNIASDSLLDR